jgi:hypothetical protein
MLSEIFSKWLFCYLAGILKIAFKALKSLRNSISQQRSLVSRRSDNTVQSPESRAQSDFDRKAWIVDGGSRMENICDFYYYYYYYYFFFY